MARRRLLYHYFYLTYGGERYSEEVTVSPFSPGGGADGFSVMSSKAWEVLSSPSWLWMSTDEGEKGMTQIQISAGTYAGGDMREDNITIRTIDGRYTAMIHVSQMADVPYITVTGQPAGAVSFRNEYTVLSVSSKGGWTAAVTGATLNPTAQTDVESIETEVYVTYGKNTSTSDTRTVTVVFTNTQDPTKSVTVTITQAPQSYIDLEWAAGTPALLPWNGWDGFVTVGTNISSYLGIDRTGEGAYVSPSEVPAGASSVAAHIPGNSSTAGTIFYTVSGKTSDWGPDGIDEDSVSIEVEAMPYLNVPDITIQSGETTGTVTYASNYTINPNSFTGAGISEIAVEGDILTVKTSSTPLWNEDRTLTLQVETIGTVGPSAAQTVNVTQKGKVAELTAEGHTTNKNAGSTFITFNTNDTITVDTTGFPSWLSFDRIDYDNGKVWLTVTENTGTAARDHDITLTTTHSGATGQPVSQTVTLTQGANTDTRTNVTVNAYLKQDSSGRWYIITDTVPASIVNFNFTMVYGNTQSSLTALTNESNWRMVTGVGGQTAVGTEITVNRFSPPEYDAGPNPGHGENYYDITYVSSATVYSTWVSGYDEVELKSLNYAQTEIPASGGSVTPTSYTVSYREVIANSFDDSTTLSEEKEITINSRPQSINGTTENGGSITPSTSTVSAPSRGAVSGDTWDVAEITAVTFVFSGNTYTDSDINHVTITQQKNEAYCEEYVVCGSTSTRTTTEYRNSGFTTSPSSYTYHASGGTRQFTVRVTADTRTNTTTTYDVTPHTACTYDSGSETDEAGTTRSQTDTRSGSWTSYSEHARFWSISGDSSWFTTPNTGGSKYSPITVTASTRGTTAGNARPNAYLVFDSPLNVHDEVAITINQAANSRTCDGGTTSTRTTREEKPSQHQSVSVSISASETSFKANGKTYNGNNYATITASETARTRTVTDVTTYTDTAYTCQWSSKATESWTDVDNTGVTATEYGTWQTYYPTPVISVKASTGNSLSYDSTNQRVTATNLGTVTGETNSIRIQAVSTVDASKTDTVTLNQDVNTITDRTCVFDVNPTSIQFTDTTTSSTVSITSRTTTEYASEDTKTETTTPNVSISGDSQHFAQTMSIRSGVYRSTVTSTYPSTPGGPTLPLAYVKYSSPDCPSETESVEITYNGPAPRVVYPTITRPGYGDTFMSSQVDVKFNFKPSGEVATTGRSWQGSIEINVNGYDDATQEPFMDIKLKVFISGTTVANSSAPNGVSFSNVRVRKGSGDSRLDVSLLSTTPNDQSLIFEVVGTSPHVRITSMEVYGVIDPS